MAAREVNTILKKVLQWAIMLAAYAFLIYTLCSFDHYSDFLLFFRQTSALHYLALVACLLLMPVNLLLEAWKWQTLLKTVEPQTLRNAFRQVCYGMAGAFVTPYRIGDYPSRVLLLKDKNHYLPAITMAAVGSVALTAVILMLGIPAFALSFTNYQAFSTWNSQTYLWLISLLLCILLLVLLLVPLMGKRYSIKYSDCGIILLQSLFRYICFSLQLWLILYACGVSLPLTVALVSIPLYYLFVTVTPNMPAADIGIRGAWAVFVFGQYIHDVQANIILATTCLWFINTLLPVLFGIVGIKCSKSA
ncbi:MAG: lysylphosphatidylglycerol synthase domain-containing protein [Paludibacteraceae bacterium]|nr:lysylphosphatidylglycerol synthase domain-containing protein [Paludibacteraceae bacterium]